MKARISGDVNPKHNHALKKKRVYKLSSPLVAFMGVLIVFPVTDKSFEAFFILMGICGIAACVVYIYGPRAVVNHTDLWLATWFGPPLQIPWTEVTAVTLKFGLNGSPSSIVELQVKGRTRPLILRSWAGEENLRDLFKDLVRNAKLHKTGEQLQIRGLLRLASQKIEYWTPR